MVMNMIMVCHILKCSELNIHFVCCVVSGPGMALVVEFVPFSLVVLSIVDWQCDCSSGNGQQTRGRTIH